MNLYKNEKMIAAFEEYVRRQNALLPDDDVLGSITFSEEFESQMHRLLARRRHGFYVLFGTAGRRVASIVAAVLVAMSVATVSVEALREPVGEFFAQVFEKFTHVFFVNDVPPTLTAELVTRKPSYIPEGYAPEQEITIDTAYKMVYGNDMGKKLRYTQRFKKKIGVQVDTENVQYTSIVIGDQPGIIYHNKEMHTITFSDNKYTYTLSGSISVDELLKIAESLIFLKKLCHKNLFSFVNVNADENICKKSEKEKRFYYVKKNTFVFVYGDEYGASVIYESMACGNRLCRRNSAASF